MVYKSADHGKNVIDLFTVTSCNMVTNVSCFVNHQADMKHIQVTTLDHSMIDDELGYIRARSVNVSRNR